MVPTLSQLLEKNEEDRLYGFQLMDQSQRICGRRTRQQNTVRPRNHQIL
jgi:hypothetical protein